MFTRIKKVKGHYYAYLVENNWNKEKKASRQKVIRYIGKVDYLIPLKEDKIRRIIDKYEGTCCNCFKTANTIDHIKPLCLGGTNDEENLQTLCTLCNQKKSGKKYFNELNMRTLWLINFLDLFEKYEVDNNE